MLVAALSHNWVVKSCPFGIAQGFAPSSALFVFAPLSKANKSPSYSNTRKYELPKCTDSIPL